MSKGTKHLNLTTYDVTDYANTYFLDAFAESMGSSASNFTKLDEVYGEINEGFVKLMMTNATFYVDNVNGDDSNKGTLYSPLKTIEPIADLALHAETITIKLLKSYSGDLKFKGIGTNKIYVQGINSSGASDSSVTIYGTLSFSAFTLASCSHLTIDVSSTTDLAKSGVEFYACNGEVNNTSITCNVLYNQKGIESSQSHVLVGANTTFTTCTYAIKAAQNGDVCVNSNTVTGTDNKYAFYAEKNGSIYALSTSNIRYLTAQCYSGKGGAVYIDNIEKSGITEIGHELTISDILTVEGNCNFNSNVYVTDDVSAGGDISSIGKIISNGGITNSGAITDTRLTSSSKQIIECTTDSLLIGNPTIPNLVIESKNNPQVNVNGTAYKLYHAGNKPTLNGITNGNVVLGTNNELVCSKGISVSTNGYFNCGVTVEKGLSVGDVITTNGGAIEIVGTIPHIDFHYNKSSADYTSRIIETASGLLSLTGKMRGGTAYTDYTTQRFRNIAGGTEDLTAGTSTLNSGDIYIVYE